MTPKMVSMVEARSLLVGGRKSYFRSLWVFPMNVTVYWAALLFLELSDGFDVEVAGICEVASRFAKAGWDGVVAGKKFVGVAGALGEVVCDDEVAAFDVGGGLAVVALGVAGPFVFSAWARSSAISR